MVYCYGGEEFVVLMFEVFVVVGVVFVECLCYFIVERGVVLGVGVVVCIMVSVGVI